ncbi:MAG: hypothetical protein Q8L24_01610, partial [bacterium]|nr:hypothetical protein [bacterium]
MNTKTKISLLFATGYLLLAGTAFADSINSGATDHYAWNDVIGWIDFGGAGAVDVSDAKLTGYTVDAPPGSQYGNIALDCSTTPAGPKCAAEGGYNWGVANDSSGHLSGWAWNDNIGWISFCGNADIGSGATGGCPAIPTYQVKIDGVSGDFSGWAWNDVVGWISFNCSNAGVGACGNPAVSSNYKVSTTWRPPSSVLPPVGGLTTGIGPGGTSGTNFDDDTYLISSVFDTQVQKGAALNTVMWTGDQPSGTAVGIKIASSNCPKGETDYPTCTTGDWTYFGPAAPGIPKDNENSAYEAKQGRQFRLNPLDHNNKR